MRSIKVSDGLILVPESIFQCVTLWVTGFYIGQYENCCRTDAYPLNRRLKIYFN